MARIRSVKPSFFKNEQLADLPMQVRLLFIGLWTLADKEGKLEDRPKRIKVELFPYDNLDIDALLSRLHTSGFIIRYEVGELKVIKVINFTKHQRITGSESDSVSDYPEPSEGNILETLGNTSETPRTTGREGKGYMERKGKEVPPAPVADKIFELPFSENFKSVWNNWKDYKLKEFKFKFKSRQSEQASITELLNLSEKNEKTAIATINQSMANGWKGFFELKKEPISDKANSVPAKELEKIRNHQDHKIQREINYLYERFFENSEFVTHISIEVQYYDFLKRQGFSQFTREEVDGIRTDATKLAADIGKTDQDSILYFMKKVGVIEIFKQLKEQGKETVFDVDRKETTAA